MKRVEEIVKEYKDLSAKIFYETKEQILKEYQDNRKEITEGIRNTFRDLFMEAYKKQEDGQKKAISIIAFFYLNSSLLTGSYKYLISLYDEDFYLDQNEVSKSYCPDFIIPYFQSDIQLLEVNMRKQYIRIKNYEMERIQFLHIQYYYELMKSIFCDAFWEIKNLPEYHILKKSEKPLFIYGGYRDYVIDMEENYAAFSDRS